MYMWNGTGIIHFKHVIFFDRTLTVKSQSEKFAEACRLYEK